MLTAIRACRTGTSSCTREVSCPVSSVTGSTRSGAGAHPASCSRGVSARATRPLRSRSSTLGCATTFAADAFATRRRTASSSAVPLSPNTSDTDLAPRRPAGGAAVAWVGMAAVSSSSWPMRAAYAAPLP